MDTLKRVFEACYPSELARRLRISPQALYEWRCRGQVPVARVLDVEAITGIPRHELRPDIYPPKRSLKQLKLGRLGVNALKMRYDVDDRSADS